MRKSKKWLILALSVLCGACVTLGACKKEEEPKDITFVDFEDGTINVEIGDKFSIRDYMKVYDENGVMYGASAVITDSKGNAVDHLAYEFTIADETGYTLVLTVRDPVTGEALQTRTLALNTVDESAPYITVGAMPEYGLANVEVELPVRFSDKGVNYTTNVVVQKINYNATEKKYDESLAENIEVGYESKGEVANFTPTRPGRYKITVEAWDGTDKATAQANAVYRARTWYYEVKGVVSEGEIEGFDTPETVVASYNYDLNAPEEDWVYQVDTQGNILTQKDGVMVILTPELEAQGYKGKILYKSMPNKTAVWHEEYEGRYGVVSTKGNISPDNGKTEYYFKSSYRATSFYRYGVDGDGKTDTSISWADDSRWTHVSVWLYVAGEAGETVEISSAHNVVTETVNCNEWFEFIITKQQCNSALSGAPYNVFSGTTHTIKNLLTCAENREIYVDKISYEFDESLYYIPMEDNEVETFSTSNTVVGAYGYNTTASKMDKNVPNETAVWHAEFEGKTGVVSLKSAKKGNYGAEYYLTSASRGADHWRYANDDSSTKDATTGDSWRDDTRWDYLSVWVYIVGEAGATVEVSAYYDIGKVTVNCNEWVELQFTKTHLGGTSKGNDAAMKRPYYTLASAGARNDNLVPLFVVGNGTETDYTVYVDSISYEKYPQE